MGPFGEVCDVRKLQHSVTCSVSGRCLTLILSICVLSLSPGEETAVWQCLTLLEEGLSHSPSNAQFKLLLIRIYCRLGAFEPVGELYSSLDAKHIQHDTIGWVVYTENNWGWGPSSNQSQDLRFPLLRKVSTSEEFHMV